MLLLAYIFPSIFPCIKKDCLHFHMKEEVQICMIKKRTKNSYGNPNIIHLYYLYPSIAYATANRHY